MVWLLIGSVADRLRMAVPSHVFEIRNFIDSTDQGGYITKEQGLVLKVKCGNNHFALRKKSSDLKVFNQIWINEEFKPVVETIRQHQIKIETILDAGANIGLSTIYLKNHFPQAKVVCVEPDKSNITQLKHNLVVNSLEDCTIFEGGIWSNHGWLDMDYSFRDGLEWSRTLKPSINGNGTIPVSSIEDVRKQNGWSTIDLLKMDIEGAEDVIFSKKEYLSFLGAVKVLTIEIHDTYNTGHRVVEALLAYGFRIFFSGELMIGINNTVCKTR